MRYEKRLLITIILIYLFLGVTYSVVVPIFEAPDEVHHFFYIKHLVDTRHLPVQHPDAPALWAQEGSQPPLYYVLAAVLVRPIPTERAVDFLWENPHRNVGNPFQPGNKNYFVHTDKEKWPYRGLPLAVHVARWFSLLLGAGTLMLIHRMGQRIFPENAALRLALVAVVAFLPQYIFIHAAVTNDAMITFTATWALLLMTGILSQGVRYRRAALLGWVVGLAALSKLSGLGLIPLGFLVLLYQGRRPESTRRTWLLLLIYTGILLLTAGWWYARNYVLYHDPTGLAPMLAVVGHRDVTWTWTTILEEWRSIRWSFWGLFGWFNIPMSLRAYTLLDRLLMIIALGWAVQAYRLRFHFPPRERRMWALLLLWVGIVLASLARWTSITLGGQGRLLFPALASIAALLIVGWTVWWPRGWRNYGAFLFPLILLTLALAAPILWIAPAYAKPPRIPPDRIPSAARRVDLLFGQQIRLWAVDIPQITTHPGEPVDITLYMGKVGEIPVDYTMYIHFLGRRGEDVGQLNTFPGWGTYPTRLWKDGEVIQDHYTLTVAPHAQTPTLLRVEVGFYNLWTRQGLDVTTLDGKPTSAVVKSLRLVQKNPPQYRPQVRLYANFANELALIGMDPPPRVVHPGETFTFHLYWKALRPASASYTVFTHLIRKGNPAPIAQHDKFPLDGDYPTLAWAPGEIVKDSYTIKVPENTAPGTYELVTGMYLLQTLQRLPLVEGPANPWVENGATLMDIEVAP
ncbi:MAG: glycosyltransferase family 39 protein [Chloroflexi bacterium]|nr:glycosyltransferase family 39 protein [Chloroflexota bacterium]